MALIAPAHQPGEAFAGETEATIAFNAGGNLASSFVWVAVVAVCAAAVLAVLVIAGVLDARAILAAALQINAATLTGVLALSLANYGLRGLRWHLFAREIAPSIGCRENLGYYFTGFAFLITPAKVGEVVRLWLMKLRHGVPYSRSLSILVLDRMTDLVSLLLFAALGAIAATQHAGAIAAFIVILAAGAALLCVRRFVVTSALVCHRLTGRRWPGLFRFGLGSYRTVRELCRPRVLGLAIGLSIAAWGAQIAGMWLLLDALGLPVDPLFAAFVFSFSVLMGVVPFFPGGVGGAEATMVGLLLLAGMSSESAVTATIISRLATLWFALLIGFVVAPVEIGRARARGRFDRSDVQANSGKASAVAGASV
ncbi:MAG: YbhN family protein [Hyphomicrobiaceae bacterium]